MKRLLPSTILLLILILIPSCIPEEGDPNLAGTWTCEETSEIFMKSTKGTSIFTVTFSRDATNPDQYRIDNFYRLGIGVNISVLVSGYSISIPRQTVAGFVFEGSGTISADYGLIEMTYTADDFGDQIDHVEATFSR